MHAKLGSSTVLSLVLKMSARGTWVADVVSDSEISLSGAIELVIGDGIATLCGTVHQGESSHGRFSARVVGGKGQLKKVLAAKAYANTPMLLPLREAVEAAGEGLDDAIASSPILLNNTTRWIRRRDTLGAILDEMADELGATWRVTPSGKVWIGVDVFPVLPATASSMEELPISNSEVIACEDALVIPGVSVGGRSVVDVVHSLSGNTWRSTVYYG